MSIHDTTGTSSSLERITVSSSLMLSPALSCGRHLNSFRTSSAVKEPFLLSRGVHRVVADRLFALRGNMSCKQGALGSNAL